MGGIWPLMWAHLAADSVQRSAIADCVRSARRARVGRRAPHAPHCTGRTVSVARARRSARGGRPARARNSSRLLCALRAPVGKWKRGKEAEWQSGKAPQTVYKPMRHTSVYLRGSTTTCTANHKGR